MRRSPPSLLPHWFAGGSFTAAVCLLAAGTVQSRGQQQDVPVVPGFPLMGGQVLDRMDAPDHATDPLARATVSIAAGGVQSYSFYPQAGTLWRDIIVNNHVDLAAGAAIQDFDCTDRTYNDHTGHDSDLIGFREQAIGVPVFAALDGTVGTAVDGNPDQNTTAEGQPANWVSLNHGGGHISYYYHLKNGSVAVTPGQVVTAGTQLGLTGSSGNSTWPHLHFESRLNGVVYEPSSGACRPGASNWTSQIPVRVDTFIRSLAVSASNFENNNGLPFDQAPRTGTFALGAPSMFLRISAANLPASSSYTVTLARPDGSLANNFANISLANGSPKRWFWYWFRLNPAGGFSVSGEWKLRVSLNGVLHIDAPITVVPNAGMIVNRAPFAVQAVTLEPANPTTADVPFCRVTPAFPERADPDFDVTSYRYRWFVNGVLVRSSTNAALSDALRKGVFQTGDALSCTVTPFDGVLTGPVASISNSMPTPPPTNLVVLRAAGSTVRLNWSGAPGATSYTVKRGTTPGGETVLQSGLSTTTYLDTTAVKGQRYYYVVTAAFGTSQSSATSEVYIDLGSVDGDTNGDDWPDLIWRNTATGASVVWHLTGTSLASQATYPTVADPTWQQVATADVDNDGKLDLIWRNNVTGANVVWFMNDATLLGQESLLTVADVAWQIVGSADINRDGQADLIWRHLRTGENAVWYLNRTSLLASGNFLTIPDLAWQLAAVADVSGDGAPDFVWRNTQTGDNLVWYLSDPMGTTQLAQLALPALPDLRWQLGAALDFNADGWPDLLWRHSVTGVNVVWFMNATSVVGSTELTRVADPTWRLLGATRPEVAFDANRDRRPDLLWRNSATGANLVWYLTGVTLTGQASLPTVSDPTWQIAARADVDRDGYPDVIWRNTASGANLVWYLNGTTLVGQASLPAVADPNWRLVAAADLNADTYPDLVWRHAVSGANLVWYLNDATLLGQASLPTVADTGWRIVATADVNGDTRPDLIWRHGASGANVVWYLNGTTWLGQDSLPTVADTTWQIAGAADINGDLRPDLIWRNTTNGANLVWYLNGTTLLGQENLPTVADTTWTLRPGGS